MVTGDFELKLLSHLGAGNSSSEPTTLDHVGVFSWTLTCCFSLLESAGYYRFLQNDPAAIATCDFEEGAQDIERQNVINLQLDFGTEVTRFFHSPVGHRNLLDPLIAWNHLGFL